MPMHLHLSAQLPPPYNYLLLVNVLYCMMACKRRLKFIQGSGKKGGLDVPTAMPSFLLGKLVCVVEKH